MKSRALFLLRTYLWTVLVFIIAKVVFMLACHEATPVLTIADMKDVILHGLSLDLSTGLYILIVPFILSITAIWYWAKWLTLVLRGYFLLVSFAMALAFVADTSLYPFWGFKLDASCLQYLETPTEAAASVSGGYLLWRLVVLVIVTAIVFEGYVASVRKQIQCIYSPNSVNLLTKFSEFACHVLMVPLFIIGIRGGFDESTTNIGQVYYSQNQFLNHAAVNPVFSFLYSLSHQIGNTEQYQFMTDDECEQLLKDIYTTDSKDTDTLLTTTRPDIIIILLESCGEQFANAMPRLQQLKKEGISFNQCYGNSWRTDRGTVCTLSGYPSFPSLSVMKMPEKSRTLPSIARTLREQNYKTYYLYGGDINFTNMRSYLISTQWEQLEWKADYSNEEQRTAEWGVRDDITFGTLYDHIAQLQPDSLREERLLAGYSTLSSHEPWDVPEDLLADKVDNAFLYLDQCIDNFINRLKQSPQWKNLLVIMVADHGINHNGIDEQTPLQRNHIPMLWVGGAVKQPRTVSTLCNQTDLCATLLGQLRLPHNEFTFSRDILSSTYTHPTAVHNYNNAQLLVDSTGYILYDLDAGQFTVSKAADPEQLLNISKAILQTTTNDLINR